MSSSQELELIVCMDSEASLRMSGFVSCSVRKSFCSQLDYVIFYAVSSVGVLTLSCEHMCAMIKRSC